MNGNLIDFKSHLMKQGKSINTIESYLRDINQFYNYLQKCNKQLKKISNIDIENYKDYLINNKKLKIKTVNRKLVSINQYLQFNHIAINIRQEKIQSQNFLSNIITNNEVRQMINTAYELHDLRAKAIIYTLYYTGMRVSEMLQLTIHDIDKTYISIKGKGNKFRTVFVPDKLLSVWSQYSNIRIEKSDKLFTGERGGIDRQTVDKILKNIAKLSNVDINKAHAHNFRHLYCKNLINNNVDISTVADLCGHSNINTTRLYTRLSANELISIINEL